MLKTDIRGITRPCGCVEIQQRVSKGCGKVVSDWKTFSLNRRHCSGETAMAAAFSRATGKNVHQITIQSLGSRPETNNEENRNA